MFTDCIDMNDNCASWASAGWCERASAFMNNNCPKSCNKCDEDEGGTNGTYISNSFSL